MLNSINNQKIGRPQINHRMNKQTERQNIDISRIPDCAFIPAIRRRNIVRAQIDEQPSDRKTDIKIITPLGDGTNISRSELTAKYRYLTGKLINLHGWKRGQQYNVFSADESTFFFMQVPINLTATVRGYIANKKGPKNGDYIVCYGGADGKVDRRTAAVISAKMFHKMFSVPEHPVITKNRGKKSKVFFPDKKYLGTQNGRTALQSMSKTPGTTGAKGVRNAKVGSKNPGLARVGATPEHPTYGVAAATLPGVDKSIARPLNTPTVNRVKTVGKLMNGSKLVGFILCVDGKKYKKVGALKMKGLIAKGIVTDVMVQHNSYGVEFFRGNSIQIESLPERQVKDGASLNDMSKVQGRGFSAQGNGATNPAAGTNPFANQAGVANGGRFGSPNGASQGFQNPYSQNGTNWQGGWNR